MHTTKRGPMTTSTLGDSINYDPYDFEVDADPYPTFRRLRDEAPIYYNRKYDFYALSRYDDIKRPALSGRSTSRVMAVCSN